MATQGSHWPRQVDRRPALPVRPDAVERLGDEARGGRLAHPAHAGHQEGMGQPAALDRVGQRLHHRVLPDQFGKGLRPVLARQHAIGLHIAARCRRRRGLRRRRHVQAKTERLRHIGIAFGRRIVAKDVG
jgi:hypothetical protein